MAFQGDVGSSSGNQMLQCDCDCHDMGGVSPAGWIVISLFVGLTLGSVFGVLMSTWFLKRMEKDKRQSEATGNWRIIDRPAGRVGSSSYVGRSSSTTPGPDEFNFAPMSMHKQKLLASSNSLEIQMLQASHSVAPYSGSTAFSASTPHSSFFSPGSYHGADGCESSHEENPMNAVRPHSSDTGRSSSAIYKHSSVNEEGPFSIWDPCGPRKNHSGPHHHHSLSVDNVCSGSDGSKLRKSSMRCSRTSSGLSDEFLASIHTATTAENLLESYGMGDLTDDWKEILGAIDRMLAELGEPPLGKAERAVAMKILLNASESDGVDLALEGALEEVLIKRRGPTPVHPDS